MNLLDTVIVVLLGYCLLRGIFRGIVKELAAIVGVLAGYYAAYTYYPQVGGILGRWVSDPSALQIISFASIFLVVFLAVSMLGVVIRYLLRIAFLGWLDRIAGALLGIAKAVLICAVLLVALTSFLPRESTLVRTSVLAPHVAHLSDVMILTVSESMEKLYQTGRRTFQQAWPKGH